MLTDEQIKRKLELERLLLKMDAPYMFYKFIPYVNSLYQSQWFHKVIADHCQMHCYLYCEAETFQAIHNVGDLRVDVGKSEDLADVFSVKRVWHFHAVDHNGLYHDACRVKSEEQDGSYGRDGSYGNHVNCST